MGKFHFEKEYELHASQALLYPYLTTASGLAEWFADNVKKTAPRNYIFSWDGEEQPVSLEAQKKDRFVRFLYSPSSNGNGTAKREPYFIEFHLMNNELTDSTFLRVVDETGFDDLDELEDIWDGMVEELRKKVGG